MYVADVIKLVEDHEHMPHAYADDLQIYGYTTLRLSSELMSCIIACINQIQAWMASNRLRLNHTNAALTSETKQCKTNPKQCFLSETIPKCFGIASELFQSCFGLISIFICMSKNMQILKQFQPSRNAKVKNAVKFGDFRTSKVTQ